MRISVGIPANVTIVRRTDSLGCPLFLLFFSLVRETRFSAKRALFFPDFTRGIPVFRDSRFETAKLGWQ